jgi:hypothetical protein
MTKKNRKEKKDNPPDIDPAEVEATESLPAESEAAATDSDEPQAADDDNSIEDILDDVRRSLIEDEAEADQKKPAWWNRRSKGKPKEPVEEIVRPEAEAEFAPIAEPVSEAAPEQGAYLDEIDDLIDMLDSEVEAPEAIQPATVETAPPAEPEPAIDVTELKKRVFSPGQGVEESEVRSIALEGGEDVFVEVEAKTEDTLNQRAKAFENSLRPYRGAIYFAFATLGIIIAVVTLAAMYSFYQRSLPPPPTEISNLPFPTSMQLPGGLNFNLGKGTIVDGAWNPRGPEWLQGTEICRWVAIPWSRQLEAVVRTLTQKDTINLVMSNNDSLTYTVFSIQEMTLAEMQAMDSTSPCLLLVLTEQDSDQRWAVIAKP